jgi:hypothetical protein
MPAPAGDGAIAARPHYPAIVALHHYMINVLILGRCAEKERQLPLAMWHVLARVMTKEKTMSDSQYDPIWT